MKGLGSQHEEKVRGETGQKKCIFMSVCVSVFSNKEGGRKRGETGARVALSCAAMPIVTERNEVDERPELDHSDSPKLTTPYLNGGSYLKCVVWDRKPDGQGQWQWTREFLPCSRIADAGVIVHVYRTWTGGYRPVQGGGVELLTTRDEEDAVPRY